MDAGRWTLDAGRRGPCAGRAGVAFNAFRSRFRVGAAAVAFVNLIGDSHVTVQRSARVTFNSITTFFERDVYGR